MKLMQARRRMQCDVSLVGISQHPGVDVSGVKVEVF